MAKEVYIGIGDKARHVNFIYVGVDGVARKVVAGYIGVNGIAREFYRAGVKWLKYACTAESKQVEVEYTYYEDEEDWGSYYKTDSVTGAPAHRFDSTKGEFRESGGTVTYSGSDNGTVYNGGGSSITETRYIGASGQAIDCEHTAVETTGTRLETKTTYTVGNSLGSVYVDDGARPDSDKGYSYVGTYNGYTIMKSGSTYYAYKKA